jgi:hypothetical protein
MNPATFEFAGIVGGEGEGRSIRPVNIRKYTGFSQDLKTVTNAQNESAVGDKLLNLCTEFLF